DEQRRRVPILAPPRGGDVARRPAFDLACEGERGATDVGEGVLGADADVHVDALAARRLRPTHAAELVEYLADHAGHPPDPVERALGHGIEVDAPLVGL